MPRDLNETDIAPSASVEWHPAFGPAVPDLGWVPAPRYLLRRAMLLEVFDRLPRGSVLEIGCGSGTLLAELAGMGFTGTGVDQSQAAVKLARAVNPADGAISISQSMPKEEDRRFDLLCAFEVLEHIEDDLAALREWSTYHATGGTLVISVPAHPKRWNPADVWAGHYRRYTRESLASLAIAAGYEVERIDCYGFPLGNVMERLSAPVYARRNRRSAEASLDARTAVSGTDRGVLTRLWPIYRSKLGSVSLSVACAFQRRFKGTERGTGYILTARKRAI